MGGWAPGWSVQPTDFDGNGRTDFFLYGANGTWFKVLNSGTTFDYFTGGWGRWQTTIADLDGDGNDDVFLYDRESGDRYQAFTTRPGAFRYTAGTFPK